MKQGFLALWMLAAASAQAQSPQFLRDCQPWIEKKGYSTDYIEQKTGKRQPGLAGSWRGNVALQEVEPGDVVLISLKAPGAMHAALVERIERNADKSVLRVQVSEWNWGRTTEARCLVTENFGRAGAPRLIEASAIAQVWRPSQPLPR